MQKQKWSEKGKKDQQKRRVDAEERVKIQGRKNSRRLLMKTKNGFSIQGRRKQKQKQKTWSRDAGEERKHREERTPEQQFRCKKE